MNRNSNCVSGPNNYQSHKVLLTADLLGISLMQDTDSEQVVLRLNGLEVCGANACMRTLAKMNPQSDLFGKGFSEYAGVEEMIDWVALELEPYIDLWLHAKSLNVTSDVNLEISEELREKLAFLERRIGTRSYLVGEQLTLADISLVAALFQPLSVAQNMLPETSAVFEYMNNLTEDSAIKRILGYFGAGATLAVEENDPSLHGSVEDFRECIKNGVSNMWSDLNGFSLWKLRYRYTEYNIVVSVSQSKAKKFAELLRQSSGITGSLSVNGTERPFEITGAILYEGTDLPNHLSSVKESQFYEIVKVSSSKKGDRELFEEYLCGDVVEGGAVQQRVWI